MPKLPKSITCGCALAALLALAGCETPTTGRYTISADNNVVLKKLNASGIGIGSFAEPASYDVSCRLEGNLKAPDGLTHTQYIRKALEDELKVADAYAASSPRVTLSGQVTSLKVASMHGLTSGEWDIALHLASSNGKALDVAEHYRFKSGFSADAACRNTAEAFLPAVQDLIRQLVSSPDFPGLLS